MYAQPPQRTRIKFCGMTRAEDVQRAVALGVDAIGLILVPGSKRALGLDQASVLRAEVPALVHSVLLVMNADAAFVRTAIQALRPDLVQFHGDETPEFCAAFELPFLKAVPMASVTSVAAYQRAYAQAAGFVFDSHAAGAQGGSGHAFDWSRLPNERSHPLLLAGGLTPANVQAAVRAVRPYAVDVSSGIESAPGLKCPQRMQQFVDEVHHADRSPSSQ
jgi:phosphoribosylanthranilate isomerase